MTVFNDDDYNSDDEVHKKQHTKLLNEVLHLDQRRIVKKAVRTEPTTHVSEFNLVQSSSRNTIDLSDLTKSLKEKYKHVDISNKVKKAQKARVLPKPLEKPQAERIRRSVGFIKSKDELAKWNSIVEKNRVTLQISFPLKQGEVDFVRNSLRNKDAPTRKRFKSELDLALEQLEEPKIEIIHVENKFPLSMEEIMAKRQEMAKLRAHQSYQEAKAHKRNKIKSKTYHRIKRKEKLKLQIKEFELLQKTDPEEALRKLEQLEKTRAEERVTLRHRSTGQWAKNKQIRAKYDKESRQALSQQLQISRELTQKFKNSENSDDSDTEEDLLNLPLNTKSNSSNPWVSNQDSDVGSLLSGYRKFWNKQNNNSTAENEHKDSEQEILVLEQKEKVLGIKAAPVKTSTKKAKNKLKKKTTVSKELHCNTSWIVTDLEEESEDNIQRQTEIEDLFEDLEDTVRRKANEKLGALQKPSQPSNREKKKTKKHNKNKVKRNVNLPRERTLRPEIDEELIMDTETTGKTLKIQKIIKSAGSKEKESVVEKNIDPAKYTSVKTVNLGTQLPHISHGDEESDDDNNQRQFISEAFADDDVVNDFAKEKSDAVAEDKPKNIDLSLPGWGCWGGKNIKPSKRKRKRFLIKMPKDLPRRDQNKGNLILNEHKDKKIKQHQVSELPFPFTSVKDYEASIRAPIGETFVPQTAFRRLIKPSVVTKKGAIIEAMDESILLKQKFTQNGILINK